MKEQLRQAVIEYLTQGNPDEICVMSTAKSWSRQELIEAVRSESCEGNRFVKGQIRLALDLLFRGKEKIEDFEVITQRATDYE